MAPEALQWYIGAKARSRASPDDVACMMQGVEMCRQRVEEIKCCFRFLDPWSDGEQWLAVALRRQSKCPGPDVRALRRRADVSALFAMG
jgi:hypothetical protein